MQTELFEEALAELRGAPDLVNQVLEVTAEEDGTISVLRYALPEE